MNILELPNEIQEKILSYVDIHKKIIKMNFCCLAGKNNHFCSCEIHPESCIYNNCQTNKILHENVQ